MNVAFGSNIASEGLIETNSDRYVFGETSLIPEKGAFVHIRITKAQFKLSGSSLFVVVVFMRGGGVRGLTLGFLVFAYL